jgi:hypothetical protein
MKLFMVYGVSGDSKYPRVLERIEAPNEDYARLIFDNRRPNIHMKYKDFWFVEVS